MKIVVYIRQCCSIPRPKPFLPLMVCMGVEGVQMRDNGLVIFLFVETAFGGFVTEEWGVSFNLSLSHLTIILSPCHNERFKTGPSARVMSRSGK